MGGLDFPAGALGVGEHITDRTFIWSHPRDISRYAMSDNFAEIALPLAARTSFCITEAVCMEGSWAIVAADQLTRLLTNTTLIRISI